MRLPYRHLLIPFDIRIPPEKQDKQLAEKIIADELPGVFNWILEGLNRLLEQKNFTPCKMVDDALAKYERETDSVAMFIDHEGLKSDPNSRLPLSNLHCDYKQYCADCNYRPLGRNKFSARLEHYRLTRTADKEAIFLASRGE